MSKTQTPMCKSLGLIQGEYSFLLRVNAHAAIMIRSSIDSTGFAAATGKDSIRMWLVDPNTHTPVGAKISKYTTRTPGWQKRVINLLRSLYVLGKLVHPCSCGGTVKIYKVKEGKNEGRLFTKCYEEGCTEQTFSWIEIPEIKKAA